DQGFEWRRGLQGRRIQRRRYPHLPGTCPAGRRLHVLVCRPPDNDGDRHAPVADRLPVPRRPILLALAVAVATPAFVLILVGSRSGSGVNHVAVGDRAPAISGATLDGGAFDFAAVAGHPVLV